MIKYKVALNKSVVEFATEELANEYISKNGGDLSSVDEVEISPTIILSPVSAAQIKKALVLNGVGLDKISAALDTLKEPDRSLGIIDWENANYFERANPLVAMVGEMLGWTSFQLDQLWLFAGKL